MNRKSFRLVLSPQFVGIGIGIAVLAAEVFYALPNAWWAENNGAFYAQLAVAVVAALTLLTSCLHHSLQEEGIVRRFLWIPLYRISWDKLTFAEHALHWKEMDIRDAIRQKQDAFGMRNVERKTIKSNSAIFFATKDGLVYDPEEEFWTFFKLRHFFCAYRIRVPDAQKADAVKCFQKFYPQLRSPEE